MKFSKIVLSLFAVFIFLLPASAQEEVNIEFSEIYMEIKKPEGYIIHDADGKVLQYKKFDKRDYKRKFEITVVADSIEHIGITLVYDKSCSTYFPIYDQLKFHLKKTYPYLITGSGTHYSLDLSALPFVNKDTEFQHRAKFSSDRKALSVNEYGTLGFWYNFRHPLLLTFKNAGDDFLYYYQQPPLQETEIQLRTTIRESDIFQTNDFIELAFDVWGEWSYDIMLFSKKYDKPFLLRTYSTQGSTIKIPTPEELEIDSIGIRATNRHEIIFSKFSLEEDIPIITNNIFDSLDVNHTIKGNTIHVPANDIAYFNLLRRYSTLDGRALIWFLNVKTPTEISITLPKIPIELRKGSLASANLESPEAFHLFAYILSDSLDPSKVGFDDFSDSFWRLDHGVLISMFKDEW